MLHVTTILIILLQSILPLLPSQIIKPLIRQQTQSGVNSVLGDISYLVRFGQLPTPSINENLRISTHLTLVESLLRQRDISALSPELQQTRIRHLDQLHEYRLRGIFPQNSKYPGQRRPCFIDDAGRICAVGYLIAASGNVKLAQAINAQYQYAKISEMNMPTLDQWLAQSGLTALEAAMIQPSYSEPILHPCLVDIENNNPVSLAKRLDKNVCNVEALYRTSYSRRFDDDNIKDDPYSTTLLIYAAIYGSPAIVELLLAKGARVNGRLNDQTALLAAVNVGNVAVAQLLIDSGASLDDGHGLPAIAHAVWSDQLEAVKLLLKAGAQRNYRNDQGESLTDIALSNHHFDLANWLHHNVKPLKPALLMSELTSPYCNKSLLVPFIGQLDSPKLPQSFYDDAVSYLAANDLLEINRPLLEAGANVNLLVNGKTLLMLAAEQGNLAIVKFLLTKQIDVNFQSEQGETAYSLAVKHNHLEIAKLLLSAGAAQPLASLTLNQLAFTPMTSLEQIVISNECLFTSANFWLPILVPIVSSIFRLLM